MGTRQLDGIERGLLQSLQIDGRVAFLLVGELLGVSDQTVARRYARLRTAHGVRVTRIAVGGGRRRAAVAGTCAVRPGGGCRAGPRAGPPGQRHLWVRVASGGAEIVCMARLRPPAGEPTSDPVVLSAGDQRMVAALRQDGRAGYRQLASVTGWSQTTVRRRVAELRRAGVLYFDVDIDHTRLGLHTPASLWLSVEPGRLVAAGEELATHPQVGFAAATAMGIFGLGIIFAPAVGPVLGGYFVEYLDWRLVF